MADAELQSGMSLFRERTDTLVAMLEEMAFLVPDSALQMDDPAAELIASEQSNSLLVQLIQGLEAVDDWNAADLDALCKQTAVDAGVKLGALGPAIRIAITGKKQAPSLGDLLVVTGKDLAMRRLRAAVV
jgi:glutamyl-tRNA synthetase